MTHDAQCEWQYNRQFCSCAERALAQAQSRVTQLEAVVNTRDLAIKRWCGELAQAQGEIERLKAHMPKPCEVCWTISWEPIESEEDCEFEDHPHEGDHIRCGLCWLARNLRAQVERLTAALTELANISRSECGACIEHQEIARAALTDPGGQPDNLQEARAEAMDLHRRYIKACAKVSLLERAEPGGQP